ARHSLPLESLRGGRCGDRRGLRRRRALARIRRAVGRRRNEPDGDGANGRRLGRAEHGVRENSDPVPLRSGGPQARGDRAAPSLARSSRRANEGSRRRSQERGDSHANPGDLMNGLLDAVAPNPLVSAFPAVNTITLAGQTMPGRWILTDATKVFGWQIQKGFGLSGAFAFPIGDELVVPKFTVVIWTSSDF